MVVAFLAKKQAAKSLLFVVAIAAFMVVCEFANKMDVRSRHKGRCIVFCTAAESLARWKDVIRQLIDMAFVVSMEAVQSVYMMDATRRTLEKDFVNCMVVGVHANSKGATPLSTRKACALSMAE
jgi:hypothetical protein